MSGQKEIEVKVNLFAFLAEEIQRKPLRLRVKETTTVREILRRANEKTGGKLSKMILSQDGELKEHFSILLGETEISSLAGLETKVTDSRNLLIFPPFSGGTVPEKHKEKVPEDITFALVTVSTSRYQAIMENKTVEDKSAKIAEKIIKNAGYEILNRKTVPDNREKINNAAKALKKADILVFMGGTGIAPSDRTPESLRPLFDTELAGFSTIFTFLSYQQIGSAAILSRTTAGIWDNTLIVTLPGAPDAVRLALGKLILPEAGHILKMIQ